MRSSGTARVALVGAASAEGVRVRAILADSGVLGSRVGLFGGRESDSRVGEYDGEARMIQAPDVEEVVGHDVVFLCEAGEAADRVLRRPASGDRAVVFDLAGCAGAEVPLIHADINHGSAGRRPRTVAIPHAVSAFVSDVLHPIDAALGVRRVMAVVLRPAADFGEAGLEELREQTVRLFNFASIPKETFGSQLSFNVIPQGILDGAQAPLERRVEEEVARILGWDEPRLAARLVAVPVFHGHSAWLRIEVESESGAGDVMDALRPAGVLEEASPPEHATPMDVAQARGTWVSEISVDGLGGVWLWAVGGEVDTIPARHALRLAREWAGL